VQGGAADSPSWSGAEGPPGRLQVCHRPGVDDAMKLHQAGEHQELMIRVDQASTKASEVLR
jgi:hypothetical protein